MIKTISNSETLLYHYSNEYQCHIERIQIQYYLSNQNLCFKSYIILNIFLKTMETLQLHRTNIFLLNLSEDKHIIITREISKNKQKIQKIMKSGAMTKKRN